MPAVAKDAEKKKSLSPLPPPPLSPATNSNRVERRESSPDPIFGYGLSAAPKTLLQCSVFGSIHPPAKNASLSLSLFLFIREIGRLLAFVFLKMPKRSFNELSFFPRLPLILLWGKIRHVCALFTKPFVSAVWDIRYVTMMMMMSEG